MLAVLNDLSCLLWGVQMQNLPTECMLNLVL